MKKPTKQLAEEYIKEKAEEFKQIVIEDVPHRYQDRLLEELDSILKTKEKEESEYDDKTYLDNLPQQKKETKGVGERGGAIPGSYPTISDISMLMKEFGYKWSNEAQVYYEIGNYDGHITRKASEKLYERLIGKKPYKKLNNKIT